MFLNSLIISLSLLWNLFLFLLNQLSNANSFITNLHAIKTLNWPVLICIEVLCKLIHSKTSARSSVTESLVSLVTFFTINSNSRSSLCDFSCFSNIRMAFPTLTPIHSHSLIHFLSLLIFTIQKHKRCHKIWKTLWSRHSAWKKLALMLDKEVSSFLSLTLVYLIIHSKL